jgi:hypothetical protein
MHSSKAPRSFEPRPIPATLEEVTIRALIDYGLDAAIVKDLESVGVFQSAADAAHWAELPNPPAPCTWRKRRVARAVRQIRHAVAGISKVLVSPDDDGAARHTPSSLPAALAGRHVRALSRFGVPDWVIEGLEWHGSIAVEHAVSWSRTFPRVPLNGWTDRMTGAAAHEIWAALRRARDSQVPNDGGPTP